MDIQALIDSVKQLPQVQKGVDIIEQQLNRAPIMPEDLNEIIGMLEAVVQDPSRYPEVRAAAIKDGVISEQDAPTEYNLVFILSILVALYEYRDRLSTQGYARGGLKVAARQLESAGRGGDSMLAHINPREAEMLRRMGGSGTINPNTGLREYKGGKGILGAVLPIALSIISPVIGTAIGTAMGATGTMAGVLGGAVLGGATSALTGGDPLKGAVMGGLGGGLGGVAGGAANKALGLGLGSTGQAILGGGIVGGLSGAATGQGFAKGALQGVAGGAIGQMAGGIGGETAFERGLGAAGRTLGQAFTAGYDPKTAAMAGLTAGLTTGFKDSFGRPAPKPSEAVVGGLKTGQAPDVGTGGGMRYNYLTGSFEPTGRAPTDFSLARPAQAAGMEGAGSGLSMQAPVLQTAPGMMGAGTGLQAPQVGNVPAGYEQLAGATAAEGSSPFSMKNLGTLALLGSLTSSRPPSVNQALSTMSPEQQEYFNRPNVKWDWNKMQSDANAANMSLSEYMAVNWPQITSGSYNIPGESSTVKMAMGGGYATGGGPLGAVARLVRGGGSGRDDTVNARLSDGEYVMDAETVAMLGDGSTKEGARRLDDMREKLRKHKGKTMARGKFSPNAKSPLAYLKGAA